jgi:arylsulfatase A-like enzyme
MLDCAPHKSFEIQPMIRSTTPHPLPALRLLTALLLACLLLSHARANAAERPNIVYIMADDLGWRDPGFRGGAAQTPHLDKIAAAGTALGHFYVQPYSTQTRAALLTGRYPMRYGLQTQSILPSSQFGLAPEERTLAQALTEAGYRTAFIGKWQLGHSKPEYWPTKRGFDYFYGSLAGDIDYTLKKAAKSDWRRMEQPLKEDGYVTTLLGKDASAWIEKQDAGTPFFLLLAFAAPRGNASAPKAYLDKYASESDEARRNYLGAISALDDAVGNVVAGLQKKQLLEKTLIIFHSDNGGAVPTKFATGDGDVKKLVANNDVLRDGMGSLYEGGVRGFALVHWPNVVPEKVVSSDLLHVTDMYPTLIGLAGGKLEQAKPLDGVNIWPVLADKQLSPRKEVLINVEDLRGAIRVGEWKLIVHAALPSRVELFQLSSDPEEAENRAERDPERVQEMLAALNKYAYDMAPSKYLEEMSKPHAGEIPIYWGYNPSRR